MKLTETIVRAIYPMLVASRRGRLLPGRVGPLLGHRFLGALKVVNGERLMEAERTGRPRFRAYPGFITVAGTSRCNIRCKFCVNQWDAEPDGSNRPHMEKSKVERIVQEVFPYVRKLSLSVSGEPLYDPHFAYLLEQARRYGVFVECTTNGMLVSRPGYVDRILDNVGRINISIDGATPATYERLRWGSKFNKVCANVRALTQSRRARGRTMPEVNVRYILMKDTIDELPLMVDLAKDLGVDHLFTNHLQVVMEHLVDQSLVFHKERTNRALAAARERATARSMVVVLPEPFDLSGGDNPQRSPSFAEAPGIDLPPSAYSGRCPYLWDQAFFEADGSVLPCCNAGETALGNLDNSRDFYDIWRDDPYVTMRSSVYTPRCKDICVNCYLRQGTRASAAYLPL